MRKLCSLILFLFFIGIPSVQAQPAITQGHLIVSGTELTAMQGIDLNNLTLMAIQDGNLVAVPFQIDERKPDGTYAYQSGEKASQDPDPTFDADDELVFMAADMGCRTTSLPAGTLKAMEIEVTDKSGQKSWAYLVQFENNAPRSDKDYVSFTIDTAHRRKLLTGRTVRLGFPLDAFLADELRLKGANNNFGDDILDLWTFRGPMKTRFLISMNFKGDSLLKDEPVGYTDGPVRVLYRGSGFMKISFLKIDAQNDNYLEFYPNTLHIRQDFNCPMKYSSILKSSDMGIFLALNDKLKGSQIYSSSSGSASRAVYDGKLSDTEKNFDRKNDSSWFVINGPSGTILYRPVFSLPEWSVVTKRFIYDENTADEQVCEVGDLNVGFKLFGMHNVESPRMVCNLYCIFPARFNPGDENKLLDITDNPLKTTCRTFM